MSKTRAFRNCVVIFITLIFGIFLHGAIPFTSITTLGQALVVVGYPVSFINEGGFALYATNMGYPSHAPMSTMLAPALAIKAFLLGGFHASDAFIGAFLIWISLGYYGAYKLARKLDVTSVDASLLALLWLSFPILWMSSGYSHLHFGLVLLPFLFFCSIKSLEFFELDRYKYMGAVVYSAAAILAVFTDGYSFMFFAVGTTILLIHKYIENKPKRKKLLRSILPLHIFCFFLAYLLYSLYIGKSEYARSSISIFRGWGLDLSFIFVPTKGVHFLWDLLGLSISRTQNDFFGDDSVWISTFLLPILVLGLFSYWKTKNASTFSRSMLWIVLFGFYMAMGPSIKINATKPPGEVKQVMDSEYASFPTGNSLISKYLPGFRNMRASFRWIVLVYFGLWGMTVSYIASLKNKKKNYARSLILITIVLFLPDLYTHFQKKQTAYSAFHKIDRDILYPLRQDVAKGEVVAFLPWGNDFLVNYLAPSLNIKSYNIGGDKNVEEARKSWPETMKAFSSFEIDNNFSHKILMTLTSNETDVVILPYINLLWAAHQWPYPIDKEKFAPIITELKSSNLVIVTERTYYSAVRLRK